MTVIANLPDLHPSLVLDFANSRGVDPRVKFSRASTATYFDEFGVMRTAPAGVPRIDYDPATGECRGLLVEEQRTNLLRYSEQFDNGNWLKFEVTLVDNVSNAPSGGATASLMIPTEASSVHFTRPRTFVTISAEKLVTVSCFVKEAGYDKLSITVEGTDVWDGRVQPRVNFNLSTQAPYAISASVKNYSIIPMGDGWFRCSITAKTTTTTTTRHAFWVQNPDGTNLSWAGDGTSGIYIWGAQLEEGSFPTSYIPTTDSQVTRAADVASMTGTNFSNWYRQDEGTFVVEGSTAFKAGDFPTFADINDGTLNNFILLNSRSSTLTTRLEAYANGVMQVAAINSTITGSSGGQLITAWCYKLNDYALSSSGESVKTDMTASVPTVTQMQIGSSRLATHNINGHIRRVAYYPRRITNEQLQALTA